MRDEYFLRRKEMPVTVLYALASDVGRHPMLVDSIIRRQVWGGPLIDDETIYPMSIVGCWVVVGIDTALLAHHIPFRTVGWRLGKVQRDRCIALGMSSLSRPTLIGRNWDVRTVGKRRSDAIRQTFPLFAQLNYSKAFATMHTPVAEVVWLSRTGC